MRRACLVAIIVAFVALPASWAMAADCRPVPQVPNCPTSNPTPAATPSPTPSPSSSSPGQANARADEVALERQFFDLVNQERSKRGMRPLSYDSSLTGTARRHSDRMAAEGRLYHNTSELRSEEFARRNGYPLMVGENVGEGPTVRWLHDAFMNSPSHRDNIIERRYTSMGIGVTVSDDTIWVTQDFIQSRSPARVASFPKSPIVPRTGSAPAVKAPVAAKPAASKVIVTKAPRTPQISTLRVPPIPAPIPAADSVPARKSLLPLAVLATLSAVGFASRRDAGAWI